MAKSNQGPTDVRGAELRYKLERMGLGDIYPDVLALGNMNWVGPVTFDRLLDSGVGGLVPWPPEADGVYVVSERTWDLRPDDTSVPLYVGSNTGVSPRFRTRIGDLVADVFGLFVPGYTGHHSGGQEIFNHCIRNHLDPKKLYIGWVDDCRCLRCAENWVYEWMEPELNIKRPSRCKTHPDARQAFAAFRTE